MEGRVIQYLRERSAQLEHELPGDCLNEAIRIAGLLLADGKRPWIGRIRDRRGDFAGLLYAWRFEGRNAPGWTTHYVCCADDVAYDPLAGEPVPVSEVASRIFRLELPVERVVEGFTSTSSLRDACVSSSRPREVPHPSASS